MTRVWNNRFQYGPFEVMVAYVCHPLTGDVKANLEMIMPRAAAVRRYLNEVEGKLWYTFIPHLLARSDNPEPEAMAFCQRMVMSCDLVVVCGKEISAGMAEELNLCARVGRRVIQVEFGGDGEVEDAREYRVIRRA